MKKRLVAISLVLVLAFAFSACKSDSGTDTVTLNIWHTWNIEGEENRQVTEDFIKEYTDAHPEVKIETHVLQDADYKTKMLTEFSGTAASIDVFSYWGAGRAGDLVNNGKLLCVEDYLSADKVGLIKQGADNNFRYGGKLYGLPQASWMMVLYCNTELFDEYGVTLPTTYDEWLAACVQFAAAGVVPVALGGGVDDGWQAAFVYEALVNRIVGASATSVVLDSMAGFSANPGFAESAARMIEMNAAGAFGKSPLEIDEETANVQFLTGAAAMRLTGTWFTNNIYTDDESIIQGKVTALPLPMVPGGNGKVTDYVGGFIDGIFVNSATKNPEIAADFAYGWALALATNQHETGDGFTAYNGPIDESNLYPTGRETSVLANTLVDGVVAWDTFLPGDLADIHIDACQALLSDRADVGRFLAEYAAIFD